MVTTRYINGLLSTIDIQQTTDVDDINIHTGTIRTDVNQLEIFDENINDYILLAGSGLGENAVLVKSAEDFGTPVNGVITLDGTAGNGKTWVLCASLTMPYILKPTGSVGITDLTGGRNTITFTGTKAFESDDFTRLEITSTFMFAGTNVVDPVGPSGVTLFDLDNNKRGAVVLFQCAIINFDDLGDIDDTNLITIARVGFITYNIGLRMTDGDLVSYGFTNFRPRTTSNTSAISADGTFTRSISVADSDANIFGNDGSFFNFDSAITVPKIIITSNNPNISGGGSLFASGSLDETSPVVAAAANGNEPDSAFIGSMFFNNNSTTTTISKQGADFAITAFADAGGGQVTASAAGHNITNGETVIIDDTTNYNGTYTASNVVASTSFEITATFVATETGTVGVGYVDVAGTATTTENIERFTFASGPNRLTYIGLENIKPLINLDIAATDGSSGKIFEFIVLRNGVIVDGSRAEGEFDNRVKGISKSRVATALTDDVFKVIVRNTEGTENITVSAFSLNITA